MRSNICIKAALWSQMLWEHFIDVLQPCADFKQILNGLCLYVHKI